MAASTLAGADVEVTIGFWEVDGSEAEGTSWDGDAVRTTLSVESTIRNR